MADDDESLDEILSGPVKQPVAEAEPEVEQPSEPIRDEHGRFAPKPGEEEPEVTEEQPEAAPEAETEEHNAPVAAVIAERRKAQAERERADKLATDLAELRGQISVLTQRTQVPPQPQAEPVKPPDFWDDPSKYVEHALTPFQQQLEQATHRASRAEAIAEFGKETVTAAQAALEQAAKSGQIDGAAAAAALRKSSDPVGDIVRWHQSSPAVQEASLRDKLRAELLAEYGIDPNTKPTPPSTPSPQKPLVKMPPSLSRIPAGHSAPERDESLDEVLSAPRRRA